MRSLFASPKHIDAKIAEVFGVPQRRRFIIHNVTLPAYRFVDLYNAIGTQFENQLRVEKIETEQGETLNQLIHGKCPEWADRFIRPSPKIGWQTSPEEETFLPIDCFWLCPSSTIRDCFIARLKFDQYSQEAQLEVASGDTDAGKNVLERIIEHSRRNSIYRNYVLQLGYETAKKDEFGDIEKSERLQVMFSSIEPVSDEDIVLTDEHLQVLQRNVIDLHTRREILEANGISARRGVLLHGPPGTGKTFACRYLCNKLEGVTRIFVSGSSLLSINSVFSFARLLQPTVLFLEDVDLLFASREINLYSTALGDMLDQMDGLRSHENISVVLTTNAIDRLEAAIKDRPGRISQCVFMDAPAAEQRRLFIQHQLARYNPNAIDLDQLVLDSEGATQAFLKEWVRRAVQIACERLNDPTQKAKVRDADFAVAMKEMRRFLDGSEGKIIGFAAR